MTPYPVLDGLNVEPTLNKISKIQKFDIFEPELITDKPFSKPEI